MVYPAATSKGTRNFENMYPRDTGWNLRSCRGPQGHEKTAYQQRHHNCYSLCEMDMHKKKILIVDDAIFCRICAALLEKEGYSINVVPDVFQVDLDRNQ